MAPTVHVVELAAEELELDTDDVPLEPLPGEPEELPELEPERDPVEELVEEPEVDPETDVAAAVEAFCAPVPALELPPDDSLAEPEPARLLDPPELQATAKTGITAATAMWTRTRPAGCFIPELLEGSETLSCSDVTREDPSSVSHISPQI